MGHWAVWSGGWCPCLWLRVGTSIPSHSTILWQFVGPSFQHYHYGDNTMDLEELLVSINMSLKLWDLLCRCEPSCTKAIVTFCWIGNREYRSQILLFLNIQKSMQLEVEGSWSDEHEQSQQMGFLAIMTLYCITENVELCRPVGRRILLLIMIQCYLSLITAFL